MSELLSKTILSPAEIQKFVHAADNPLEYTHDVPKYRAKERKAARNVYTEHKIYPPHFPSEREDAYTQVRDNTFDYEWVENASMLQRRIAGSELIGLYELMVIGKIDLLYDKWLQKNSRNPLPPHAEQGIKTLLARDYLSQIDKKNNERELYDAGVPTTVGFEVEYDDPATELLDNLTERLTGPRFSLKRIVNTYKWGLNALRNRDILSDLYKYNLHRNAPIAGIIQHRGLTPTNSLDDALKREIQTIPSHSLKMQLRELFKLRKIGGLHGRWFIQETIAGIELTPEHTEIMDALAIMTAAGYSGMKLAENTIMMDSHPKVSFDWIYYPYIKPRDTEDDHIKFYGRNVRPTAVELRVFQDHTLLPEHISHFVRSTQFLSYASYGIQAVQQPDNYIHNVELAREWNLLMEKWNTLLLKEKLPNPPDSGRHIPIPKWMTNYNQRREYIRDQGVPFVRFTSEIIRRTNSNARFRHESQTIVRDYSRNVKKIMQI